jgi:hypothetical protein
MANFCHLATKKTGATTHTQDCFGKKSAKVTKFTEFFYTEITIIGSSMLPK